MSAAVAIHGTGVAADLAALAMARFALTVEHVPPVEFDEIEVSLGPQSASILERWGVAEGLVGDDAGGFRISSARLAVDVRRRLGGFGLSAESPVPGGHVHIRAEGAQFMPGAIALADELDRALQQLEALAWRVAGAHRGWHAGPAPGQDPVPEEPVAAALSAGGGMRFVLLAGRATDAWKAAIGWLAPMVPIDLVTVGVGQRLELDAEELGLRSSVLLVAPDGGRLGSWPADLEDPARILRQALVGAGVKLSRARTGAPSGHT